MVRELTSLLDIIVDTRHTMTSGQRVWQVFCPLRTEGASPAHVASQPPPLYSNPLPLRPNLPGQPKTILDAHLRSRQSFPSCYFVDFVDFAERLPNKLYAMTSTSHGGPKAGPCRDQLSFVISCSLDFLQISLKTLRMLSWAFTFGRRLKAYQSISSSFGRYA